MDKKEKKAYIKPAMTVSAMRPLLPLCDSDGGSSSSDIDNPGEEDAKGRFGWDEDSNQGKKSLW